VTGEAPAVAYVFMGIFTFSTYLLGGIAREQVCIYMCPWPRIQAAMYDSESLLVSYHGHRGEPRGAHKRGQPWEGRGDCIDCKACVAVCPMGIDIRDGQQLECIQCALCIDACDEIMGKVDRPLGLIGYDTLQNIEAPAGAPRQPLRLLRPRVLLYSGLIALVSSLMLWAWLARSTVEISVIPDRNPLFVVLSDGSIRNGYTLKILNKTHDVRTFRLGIEGLPAFAASIVGFDGADEPMAVEPDTLRAVKVYVSVPRAALSELDGGATHLSLTVTDVASGDVVIRETAFRSPDP
jgi:cytochrome c oxidase accessory protein FixG